MKTFLHYKLGKTKRKNSFLMKDSRRRHDFKMLSEKLILRKNISSYNVIIHTYLFVFKNNSVNISHVLQQQYISKLNIPHF